MTYADIDEIISQHTIKTREARQREKAMLIELGLTEHEAEFRLRHLERQALKQVQAALLAIGFPEEWLDQMAPKIEHDFDEDVRDGFGILNEDTIDE